MSQIIKEYHSHERSDETRSLRLLLQLYPSLIKRLERFFLLLGLTSILIACASKPRQSTSSPPLPSSQPMAEATSRQRVQLSGDVAQALKSAKLVLIGETHDHPLHHHYQAEIIRILKPKVVAFEMLDSRHSEILKTLFDQPANTWDRLLDWTHRGWPDFEIYQPIFEAAHEVGAVLIPAHPTPEILHPLMMGQDLPSKLKATLRLDRPLPDAESAELSELIRDAHCGHANPAIIQAMIKAQRLKDAWMAKTLLDHPVPSVLIVGRGHTHERWGVPWALKQLSEAPPPVLVIELTPEASPPREATSQHATTAQTSIKITLPAHRTDDPCDRFREQLQKMKERHSDSSTK